MVKNPPANTADVRDVGSIPRSGTPLEKDTATQSSGLENPMDRGAWWATVHRVAESEMTKAT